MSLCRSASGARGIPLSSECVSASRPSSEVRRGARTETDARDGVGDPPERLKTDAERKRKPEYRTRALKTVFWRFRLDPPPSRGPCRSCPDVRIIERLSAMRIPYFMPDPRCSRVTTDATAQLASYSSQYATDSSEPCLNEGTCEPPERTQYLHNLPENSGAATGMPAFFRRLRP